MPAPYASFLSRAPQPADTWIRVETSREEYKLNIRLPGFDRDSITLATKRRRILHIMADSWVGIGGTLQSFLRVGGG
jgi:HSP20 family molecular chaperone IbpA